MEFLLSVAFLPPGRSSRTADTPCCAPPVALVEAQSKRYANEALITPAHQQELTLTLYNKAKAFSFNLGVTRTTTYHRKTEEIKGILKGFVR